ncbi:MAG: alanine racemase [Candidatus Bathyarchaeota archaeon]|nr:alanine racemase [Candidatus Bathyarchaeota archaeon]
MTRTYWLKQPKPAEIRRRIKDYGSWLEIDLDAITNNLNEIRRHLARNSKDSHTSEIMPCVKNNAYGHGLLPIAAHIEDNGVRRVLVAKTYEAIQIRENTSLRVVNMDPLWTPDQYKVVVEKGVTQVIYTQDAATRLSKAALKLGKTCSVFVKVDTGLRRVGIWHEEASNLIEKIASLSGIQLDGLMSTLIQKPDQDLQQIRRMKTVADELRNRNVDPGILSLASTDATLNNPEAHLDLVRPGMSLYGVYPEPKDVSSGPKLKQALSWKARIEYMKTIKRGNSVTYWGKFVAPEDMPIGTIHIGFYDGVPREMANKARILVDGQYKSSLGSISLNHILIDLNGVEANQGDIVEIISRTGENTLSRFAAMAGWMTYSILNHLNPRIPRVYTKNGKLVALVES